MRRCPWYLVLLLGLAAADLPAAGVSERAVPIFDRLGRNARDWVASAVDGVREKAPHLGDLLGLAEPTLPADAPLSVTPPLRSLRRVKTAEELRVEGLIDAAFREYFRDYTIGGRQLAVRIPFALNGEREAGRGYSQDFYFDGKGTPEKLWTYIDAALASKAFARYAAQISRPGEKVIAFTLQRRSYKVLASLAALEALDQDSYPGTPTRIFVRRNGDPLSEADVYNYLYAVSCVGVDCTGFTYHILESVALAYGLELDRVLGESLRVDPRLVRKRIGMWFFDPVRGYTERVADRIEDLRPADMLLFRGSDGSFKHSAVIQSIDFENGILRYVQSTDWATIPERGVHLSLIRFDPSRPRESLAHYSVRWLQQVRPPFTGEKEPRNWQSDRERYLWYTDLGGSMVVRLRPLASALQTAERSFYTAVASQ